MKKAAVTLFVSLLILAGTPTATASTHSGVQGLRAYVVNEYTGGSPDTLIEIRFAYDVADPDQDVGSYTYNVTIDGGSGWVNLGEYLGESGEQLDTGFRTLQIAGSGSIPSYNINVTADDGSSIVDSCVVTVDNTALGDYDACGNFVPAYEEDYCTPRDPETTLGYAYSTSVFIENDAHDYNPPSSGQALGAINLPGDTTSYEYRGNIRTSNTLAFAQHTIFFSEQVGQASASTAPEITDTNDIAGAIPRTGAFTNGIGVMMLAASDSDSWTVRVYQNIAGSSIQLWQEDTGITAGDANDIVFRIDPWANTVTLNLSTYSRLAPLDNSGTTVGNFGSFWIRETGGRGGIRSQTYHDRTSDNLCLYTAPASLGGGNGSAGLPSSGVPLEDFDGQGGFGGDPEFPGLNVQDQASAWGLPASSMGYILFAVLTLAITIGAFIYAGPTAAGVSVIGSLAVGATLNLIPYWLVVVAFLIFVSIIAFKFTGGNS